MSRKINEGFWDSLVTKAKRGSLAVQGAVGDKNAQGKLSALNLATAIYDAFKHYQGETGSEQSEDEMRDFLSKNLGFSDNFADDQARRFLNFMNGYDYEDPKDETDSEGDSAEAYKPAEAEPQSSDSRKEPSIGDAPQEEPQAAQTTDAPKTAEPKAEEPKAAEPQDAQSAEQQPQAEPKAEQPAAEKSDDGAKEQGDSDLKERRQDSTERFMQTAKYAEIVDEIRGNMANDPILVLATQENTQRVKQAIEDAKKNNTLQKLYHQLAGMGAMSSWANLQQLAKQQGVEVPKSKEGMAEFIKDALNQGGKMLGLNFVKKANLFVVGVPNKPTGDEFKLRESVQLNENLSDKDLREFFLKLAQYALKTGEAKSTAKREISSVKNRINKKGGDYKAPGAKTPGAQQSNTTTATSGSPSAINSKSTTASANTTTATSSPNDLSVKLTKADKQLIDELDGTEIVDAIDSDIPDVKELARRIISNALADYKAKK